MRLKELHPCWPEFEIKTKHYICMYQIDGKGSLPFYGNKYITNAHLFNGNLARCWQSKYGETAANQTGEFPAKTGIWCLHKGDHRIKLTVEYIDPQHPPIKIDDKPVEDETETGIFEFSEQTEHFLEFLVQKL